jgi:peptidoglycan/LPS O-acetylase OafA/YrhL
LPLVAGAALTILAFRGNSPFLLTHLSTFLFGFAVGRSRCPKHLCALTASICCTLVLFFVFRGTLWPLYTVVGLCSLMAGTSIPSVGRISQKISDMSYDIFLVHGPILAGISMIFPENLIVITLTGLPASVCGAILLRRTTDELEALFARVWTATRSSPTFTPGK